MKHIPFGSTPRFPALYNLIKSHLIYDFQVDNKCEFVEEEHLSQLEFPTISFQGTEKIHGTNGAVCFNNKDGFWVQSNSRIITPEEDNEGCARAAYANKDYWLLILAHLAIKYDINLDTHTITIFYEWCGGSIMKSNSAVHGEEKLAMIFEFASVTPLDYNHTLEEPMWINTQQIDDPTNRIFNISNYPQYTITLNLNNPEECEQQLQSLVDSVEHHSPVGQAFGHPDNTSEGMYWFAIHQNKVVRMKSKGEKHGGKPKEKKTQNPLSSEEEILYQQIAEDMTPVWRLNQAIQETQATQQSDIGKVLGWVNKDITKEEQHVFEKHKIQQKTIQKFTTQIIKDYYFNHIKGY